MLRKEREGKEGKERKEGRKEEKRGDDRVLVCHHPEINPQFPKSSLYCF